MNAKEQYCAFRAIVDKEVTRILRIWMQTLLPSAITMTLYFIIFGKFIGSQVKDINGFSYMQFIVPGIIMLSVITNSFTNVVSAFFSAKFQKSIEELLVSPTPNYIIILGYTASGVFRGLLVGIIVLLVSLLFFAQLHIYNIAIVIAFILLTSMVFSLGGLLNAIFAKRFDDISIIPTFVLMPLTYLGGVFYSIKLLPEFWQTISLFNPILYMVNGFRYGFLGISDINIWIGLGMLIMFAAILFSISLYLMRKGVGLRT
ncbi:ABC transporter permease [Candidatus Woesearchaeota archaeon]|nr:ABC transporter permease [Candidatus Woesearchaeota archaeon]